MFGGNKLNVFVLNHIFSIHSTVSLKWIALFILELNIHTRKKCMYSFSYKQVFLNLYGRHVIVNRKLPLHVL